MGCKQDTGLQGEGESLRDPSLSGGNQKAGMTLLREAPKGRG